MNDKYKTELMKSAKFCVREWYRNRETFSDAYLRYMDEFDGTKFKTWGDIFQADGNINPRIFTYVAFREFVDKKKRKNRESQRANLEAKTIEE